MKINHETRTINFRQSWLDTATRCPEQGRLKVVKPEWDQLDSDAALVGTSMHHGIEQYLEGQIHDVGNYASQWALANIDPDRVRWVKHSTVKEIADLADRCGAEWQLSIAPYVELGGRTEVGFEGVLCTHSGYQLVLEGTVDYVDPWGVLWDWKTSGWEYKPWEKQRWAIQPTVYTTAAVSGMLDTESGDNIDFSWPMAFRYGIVYKPRSKKAKCEADIVTVHREEADTRWLIKKMKVFTDLALATGFQTQWPLIDSENNLCSEAWCPWWSTCKGSYISENQYATPSQVVPIPLHPAAE